MCWFECDVMPHFQLSSVGYISDIFIKPSLQGLNFYFFFHVVTESFETSFTCTAKAMPFFCILIFEKMFNLCRPHTVVFIS